MHVIDSMFCALIQVNCEKSDLCFNCYRHGTWLGNFFQICTFFFLSKIVNLFTIDVILVSIECE